MNERINVMNAKHEGSSNLLKEHIFQFDFLNDDLNGSKVPESLRKILNDPEERKKLIIYINPPYAEAGNKKVMTGTEKEQITGVAVNHKTYKQYENIIGLAGRELFAQFFIRIYKEIPDCILAEFSTLKILQAPNFDKFREVFKAELKSLFIVPANTFDNVKGQFPVGFYIWDTSIEKEFLGIKADVYDKDRNYIGNRMIYAYNNIVSLTDWVVKTRNRQNEHKIGFICNRSNDFQSNNSNFIANSKEQFSSPRGTWITDKNLIECVIFYSVRHVIEASWLNDRDQFLSPNNLWKEDKDFQSDCLVYALFNNNIQSKYGINHWIPFLEQEIGARDRFESHFMTDFIAGKLSKQTRNAEQEIFAEDRNSEVNKVYDGTIQIYFTEEALDVMNAGKDLWKYYHKQPNINLNASYYDIREYFQGRDDSGKMNKESDDETYMQLWGTLKGLLEILAKSIAPKIYKYGFLME